MSSPTQLPCAARPAFGRVSPAWRPLLLGGALLLLGSVTARGHGTLLEPMSRVYRVYQANPEAPATPWAQAAIAASGRQPFYTWNQVSRNVPDYNHRVAVPDGKLASAGNPEYAGLDLVRADWPATPVAPGNYQLLFWATAAHEPSYFDVYLTKDTWDPSQPLTWDHMERLGSHVPYWKDSAHYWRLNLSLPPRTGRHVLWVLWQRVDPVGEVFFATSDLVFDGSVTENPIVPTPPGDPNEPSEPNDPTDPTNPSDPTDPADPSDPPVIAPAPPAGFTTQVGDVSIEFASSAAWASGYSATIRLVNVGTQTLQGWKLAFSGDFVVTSLWDASYVCGTAGAHTVVNPPWAMELPPGAGATFGFVVQGAIRPPSAFAFAGGSSESSPPEPLPDPVPEPGASVTAALQFDAVWATGFTATLRITNTGATAVDGWTLAFEAPFAITSLWNGAYALTDGVHTIRHVAWNARLEPGQTVDIGFSATGPATPVTDFVVRTLP